MANQSKEIWKQISSLKGKTTRNYAISNHGRLASFDTDLKDKLLLKPHSNEGYPVVSVKSEGLSKTLFIHNEVAKAFLKKKNATCDYVIHLDHNKANNEISNLKWVTQKEQIGHNKKNPVVLEAIARKVHTGATAKKLNEKKVLQLKKELWDPKRKLTNKKLAEKYGIAEMNLYRIRNGEMWFHIHVEGEPVFAKYKEQLKNIAHRNKQEAKATAEKVASSASATKAEKEAKVAKALKADKEGKALASRSVATATKSKKGKSGKVKEGKDSTVEEKESKKKKKSREGSKKPLRQAQRPKKKDKKRKNRKKK